MELALAESAACLLEKLPIDDQALHDAWFLGHQNHGGRKGVLAIKRLCYHVAKALDPATLMTFFNLKGDDTKYSQADQVPEQFKLKIPTSFIETKPEEKKRSTLTGSMHMAYWMWKWIDTDDYLRFCCIDHYWRNISSIYNKEGKAKCWKLYTLVNCVLFPIGMQDLRGVFHHKAATRFVQKQD